MRLKEKDDTDIEEIEQPPAESEGAKKRRRAPKNAIVSAAVRQLREAEKKIIWVHARIAFDDNGKLTACNERVYFSGNSLYWGRYAIGC